MSDELIKEARKLIAHTKTYNFGMWSADKLAHEVAPKLVDALEAAARVPVQGEPNDDREAAEVEATNRWGTFADNDTRQGAFERDSFIEGAEFVLARRATVPDAATEGDGWSTEDRQESKQEAERRWVDERSGYKSDYNRGCINGFMLGAEWQKSRETFISYKAIADEARVERDTALAAVERVRAAAEGPHPANSGLSSFTLAHILAALDGAPEEAVPAETGWERKEQWGVSYGEPHPEPGLVYPVGPEWRAKALESDDLEHYQVWRREVLYDPWLPVEGEGK